MALILSLLFHDLASFTLLSQKPQFPLDENFSLPPLSLFCKLFLPLGPLVRVMLGSHVKAFL